MGAVGSPLRNGRSLVSFSWRAFRYPKYTNLLRQILELLYHDPDISKSVLKFFCELTQNRSQRLQFDVMVPNGVLLFREVSKALVTYGMWYAHYILCLSRGQMTSRRYRIRINRLQFAICEAFWQFANVEPSTSLIFKDCIFSKYLASVKFANARCLFYC